MRRLAAVDVGSTSVHLLVADVPAEPGPDPAAGPLATVVDESAFLGLGAAVEAHSLLGEALAGELAHVLARYASRARAAGAEEVVAVCTSPCRRAPDAARFVRRVERDPGLPVHVLTAREESLLTLLGVTGGRPAGEDLAVVDVGGGSTEVVATRAGAAVRVEALDVGAATLAARHVVSDPPSRDELEAMRAEAEAVVAGLGPVRPRTAVAVGGTAENLARVVAAAAAAGSAGAGADEAAGRLTAPALAATLEALVAVPAAQAAARFGVRPARARLLPAGATILLAMLERWTVDAVRVSAAGLREGAILARSRAGPAWRDRLEHLAGGARG